MLSTPVLGVDQSWYWNLLHHRTTICIKISLKQFPLFHIKFIVHETCFLHNLLPLNYFVISILYSLLEPIKKPTGFTDYHRIITRIDFKIGVWCQSYWCFLPIFWWGCQECYWLLSYAFQVSLTRWVSCFQCLYSQGKLIQYVWTKYQSSLNIFPYEFWPHIYRKYGTQISKV